VKHSILIAKNKQVISVSLGANICSKDGSFNLEAIRSISLQFKRLVSRGYDVAAVVGLGGAARPAIETASRYIKGDDKALDELRIQATRINATLLIASLREADVKVIPTVLSSVNEALDQIHQCVGVFGGVKPGLTSDASAALIAKELGSPLIIVSTTGAIFEKDPAMSEERGNERLASVGRQYLKHLLKGDWKGAHVLDAPTCRILLGMPRGFRAMVAGYRNIASAAEYLQRGKGPVKGTLILL